MAQGYQPHLSDKEAKVHSAEKNIALWKNFTDMLLTQHPAISLAVKW